MSCQVIDNSAGLRLGLKGRAAAQVLAARGLAIPAQPNTWQSQANGGLLLRLGGTEFLLEADIPSATAETSGTRSDWLTSLFPEIAPACWQMPQVFFSGAKRGLDTALGSPEACSIVPRNDAVFTLTGAGVWPLLAELCALDFPRMPGDAAYMTDVAGVAATLIRLPQADSFRLWCDGSYRADMRALLLAHS